MRWALVTETINSTAPRNSGPYGAVVWRQNGDTAARKWEAPSTDGGSR
jgi:hypothetical protein